LSITWITAQEHCSANGVLLFWQRVPHVWRLIECLLVVDYIDTIFHWKAKQNIVLSILYGCCYWFFIIVVASAMFFCFFYIYRVPFRFVVFVKIPFLPGESLVNGSAYLMP
jgi:hypothetical protein